MRTLASSLESNSSFAESWFFPLMNAGSTASARYSATRSPILNPLYASTKSPGKSLLYMLLSLVITLSETRLSHASETNEMVPCGVISI